MEDRHYVSVVEILLRSKGRRNFTYLVSLWGNEATIIISPISKIEAVGKDGHYHRFLLFVFTCDAFETRAGCMNRLYALIFLGRKEGFI